MPHLRTDLKCLTDGQTDVLKTRYGENSKWITTVFPNIVRHILNSSCQIRSQWITDSHSLAD